MKTLYNIIIGVLGGLIGIGVLSLLWFANIVITLAEELYLAIVNRKS